MPHSRVFFLLRFGNVLRSQAFVARCICPALKNHIEMPAHLPKLNRYGFCLFILYCRVRQYYLYKWMWQTRESTFFMSMSTKLKHKWSVIVHNLFIQWAKIYGILYANNDIFRPNGIGILHKSIYGYCLSLRASIVECWKHWNIERVNELLSWKHRNWDIRYISVLIFSSISKSSCYHSDKINC